MSWRETLGITPSTGTPYAHNSQNAQKSTELGNCADIANFAYSEAELLASLAKVTRGLDISAEDVRAELAQEDIDEWQRGGIKQEWLEVFARSVAQRRAMAQGKTPEHYTHRATCNRCGPVWLWFSGEVQGCPWCWNRVAGFPIPRPGADSP